MGKVLEIALNILGPPSSGVIGIFPYSDPLGVSNYFPDVTKANLLAVEKEISKLYWVSSEYTIIYESGKTGQGFSCEYAAKNPPEKITTLAKELQKHNCLKGCRNLVELLVK